MKMRFTAPLILTTLLLSPARAQSVTTLPRLGCEPSARALLLSARSEADGRFWRQLGTRQFQSFASLRAQLDLALLDRQADLDLAQSQHEARLEICALFGGASYEPVIDPASFSAEVDHPFFPLVVGRTLVYESDSRGIIERTEVTTSKRVVEILGVSCRAVDTVKFSEGLLIEQSTSWYARHADGSVWWFGESNQTFDNGLLVGMSGSWRAGLDGAAPGVFVPALGISAAPFRRALAVGCAEEVARVIDRNAKIHVAAGSFENGLAIQEIDPLEPLELVIEILVHGIGLVAEKNATGDTLLELVSIHDAPLVR